MRLITLERSTKNMFNLDKFIADNVTFRPQGNWFVSEGKGLIISPFGKKHYFIIIISKF